MDNSFQERFNEILRIASELYPPSNKRTMQVIKCKRNKSSAPFDLKSLNIDLISKFHKT